jgi:purine-binding chemotaxis protein CheW
VSASAQAPWSDERLLTFEVAGALYALPIGGVLEVIEPAPLACIPTLPPALVGVANYHGDALPVLRSSALLDVAQAELPPPQHVLVLVDRPSGAARLGLPVDRVFGLVDGAAAVARGADPVAERRSLDGRVAHVLDPRRLVARAGEVIERSLVRDDRS